MLFARAVVKRRSILIALRDVLRLRGPVAKFWAVGYRFPTGKEWGRTAYYTTSSLTISKARRK
jgi:hypothetical protein